MCFFPYAGLYYQSPENVDFHISVIPFSEIAIKSIVYYSSSYIIATMFGKKYLAPKVDIAMEPRKKMGESAYVAFFGSIISTVMIMIVEPILANSTSWGFGPYEGFNTNPVYFGVNPIYFAGWFIASFATFALMSLAESNIETNKAKVMYDYEERMQRPERYQDIGFVVFMGGILVPTILSLYVSLYLFLIDAFFIIPGLFLLLLWFSKWSLAVDRTKLDTYCEFHPGSLLCDDGSS